jgi:hypothetical protein
MNKKVFLLKSKETEKVSTFKDELLNLCYQRDLIQCLYLENDESTEKQLSRNNDKKIIMREIKNKLQGYKQQDKKNNFYDINFFISLYDVYELLILSKLKCYYCKNDTPVLYNNSKQQNQWTLDRIENDQGHNKENCVISCLKCNLDRKTLDCKKFLFTKQMKIVKKID